MEGDEKKMEAVIDNLCSNAGKYSPTGGTIRIQLRRRGGDVVIDVMDDGPGIPEESLKDVIQRGIKLDESKPGHGQGLGIVKDISDLYGGQLMLCKSPLGGLLAELDLPAA